MESEIKRKKRNRIYAQESRDKRAREWEDMKAENDALREALQHALQAYAILNEANEKLMDANKVLLDLFKAST